jgi:hypothetical protein
MFFQKLPLATAKKVEKMQKCKKVQKVQKPTMKGSFQQTWKVMGAQCSELIPSIVNHFINYYAHELLIY